MSGWRDKAAPDVPRVSFGSLADGQSFAVAFLDDGHLTDTKHGEALEVTATIKDVPDGYTDMNGEPIEEGEDYALMTSSSRLMYALSQFADELTGEEATITVMEGETDFDRQYKVD